MQFSGHIVRPLSIRRFGPTVAAIMTNPPPTRAPAQTFLAQVTGHFGTRTVSNEFDSSAAGGTSRTIDAVRLVLVRIQIHSQDLSVTANGGTAATSTTKSCRKDRLRRA